MKPKLFRMAALAMLVAAAFGAAPASAAFTKSPTVSLANGFPTWYQDKNGLALQLCLDQTVPLHCVLPPAFDPTLAPTPPGVLPITTTGPISATNFPDESFYWLADVVGDLVTTAGTAKFRIRFALEGGFALGPVQPGQQTTFIRVNLQKMASGLVANSTYTVTTPYGVITFTTDATGASGGVGGVFAGQTFRNQLGGAAALDFASLLTGILPATPPQQAADMLMDDFLICTPGPAVPVGFIGDGVATCSAVKASAPGVPVAVTVSGNGIAVPVSFSQFVIAGKKIGMDVAPFPATPVTRAVVGGAPVTTQLTVTNLSAPNVMALGPNAVTIAGLDAADYTIATTPPNTCANATLTATAPGNTCTFTVAFAPVAAAKGPRAATVTVTPDPALAPPVSVTLSGIAQFPVTATVGANGALTKDNGTAVPATENIDAGSTIKYQTLPNDVVANVSKYRPLVKVNNVVATLDAQGLFTLPSIGAPQAISVVNVRPGDTAVDPVSGVGDNLVTLPDALETLKIVTGVNAAPTDAQRLAADVGPLVGGKPTADGIIDISDVLVVLWRAISQPPSW
jgi:hypothetical protein